MGGESRRARESSAGPKASGIGRAGDFRAPADDSPGVGCEVENDKGMLRKVAEKGVERADAGSWSSRRRVSTSGAADPLPIVRLPERDTLRNVS